MIKKLKHLYSITHNIRKLALMTITMVSGIAIITMYDGYLDALGVFLMLWSHNVEHHRDDES